MKRPVIVMAVVVSLLVACTSSPTRLAEAPSAGATSSTSSTAPSEAPSSGTTGATSSPAPPAGRIVFDQIVPIDADGPTVAYLVNADGADEHRLPVHGWAWGPVWSPDGTQLVMNTSHGPTIVDVLGSSTRLVRSAANGVGFGGGSGCIWSPDGKRLLCQATDQGTRDGLYSVRSSDGGGLARLTVSPNHDIGTPSGECSGGDEAADYSPDGTRFVFLRTRCSTGPRSSGGEIGALYVESAEGTGPHRITPWGDPDTHEIGRASWSPDGHEILFGGNCTLYLVHPDGSGLHTIPLDACAFASNWSPDERWIVFSLNQPEGSPDLYASSPDGTNLTQITHTSKAKETMPDWGPATAQ